MAGAIAGTVQFLSGRMKGEAMKYLFDGVKEFNKKDFEDHRDLFKQIGRVQTPHTRKWLELAKKVRYQILREGIEDPSEREWKAEQLNIIEQMNHLITYPYIKERFRSGKINIFGWYYIIETGEVFNYDKDERAFVRIE